MRSRGEVRIVPPEFASVAPWIDAPIALATIIELGATARRLAPLVAHRKGGHRNMTYAFALEGLFQKRRVGRGC